MSFISTLQGLSGELSKVMEHLKLTEELDEISINTIEYAAEIRNGVFSSDENDQTIQLFQLAEAEVESMIHHIVAKLEEDYTITIDPETIKDLREKGI